MGRDSACTVFSEVTHLLSCVYLFKLCPYFCEVFRVARGRDIKTLKLTDELYHL